MYMYMFMYTCTSNIIVAAPMQHCNYYVHVYENTNKTCTMYIYMYLLDIPRQPTCMKLGTRELYQPIHSWLGSYMSVA